MKKKTWEILLQIIPVMIGVYLGFLISNWSKNKQKEDESEFLVNNLISEMKTNQNRLNDVINYHVLLRDSSRYYSDNRIETKKPDFFKGISVMKLNFSAYNTGIQTGVINELSIDKIQQINQLYTLQSDYNEFGNLLMSSLINKDFTDNQDDMKEISRFLAMTMTDVVIKEHDLIEGYKKVIEELKN